MAGPPENASSIEARDAQERLEKELLQSQKMEGIGRLAGGIAHDFNNLLTIVLGHAEQLLQELPAEVSAADRVRAVHRAALRAAELTDQLLAFSQQQVVTGAPVDLNEVILSMGPMLARLVGEHIELRVSLCPGAMVVASDRLQVQQVVLNLVDNARDAMPHGGTLGITTVTASALLGPSTALLRVSDTGVGMDEATKAHIFEPFFSTKEETKGTGLGLSTVYGVVTQHGGDVDVSSAPGSGSVFTISLPLWVASNPPYEASELRNAGGGRTGTVLVVEDEAAVRELTREVLEFHGHVVVEAPDGEGALATAEAHAGRIDVLVTDVVLPRLAGPELAQRLRAARPELQVVFMSGYPDKHLDSINGRKARFLAKPFRPSDLAAAVADSLLA